MKPTILILLVFALSCPEAPGQPKQIKLNLKEGYRYVFEKIESTWPVPENPIYNSVSKKIKVIRCDVEKVIPDSQVVVKIRLLQNKTSRNPMNLDRELDYFFPEYNHDADPNIFEHLLSSIDLLYALNLKTRKAELLNKPELLVKFREIMVRKENDELFTGTILNGINHNRTIEKAGLVSFLLWFHNSELTLENQVKNTLLSGKPLVIEKSGGELQFSKAETEQVKKGARLQKFRIDTLTGIPVNYLASWLFADASKFEKMLYGDMGYATEIRINLIGSGKIKPEMARLSGRIEKPFSKKISISYIDKPFGTEMRGKTVYLDENNSFSAEFPFPHAGFIYVRNENSNRFNPPGTFVFYAEPGDSLNFLATGAQLPWKVELSGDHTEEGNLLLELRNQIILPDFNRMYPGSGKLILDFELNTLMTADFGKGDLLGIEKAERLIPSLENSLKLIATYERKLSKKSLEFIRNEVESYFLTGLLNLLIRSESWHRLLSLSQNKAIRKKIEEIEKNVENLDVREFYNDYGLYSRLMVSKYLSFQFNKQNKAGNYYVSEFGFRNAYDIEQVIQFARMIFSGSLLYRQFGELLNGQFGYIPTTADRNDSLYHREQINRNINLLIKRCNDNEFLQEMYQMKAMLQKAQSGDFVPETSFLNPEGKPVRFRDFFGTKPTLFQIAPSWTGDRYSIDEKAREKPELNFVFVTEGNNFSEWTEHLKAAEPVAAQLLLKNDTIGLRDIFIRNHNFFMVFDKKGHLEGYETDLKRAVKLAENSLARKKEPDTAQLRLIIRIMGITLIAFFIVLLVWRWRTRQQFRREQQQRRLRELELTAIRSQMNPHFLFNSLNSVQNLIQQDQPQEAHQYLADFAGLIRKVLKNSEKEEVSLAEEIETVGQYLNLEKLRFDFSFTIAIDPTLDAQNTMVPSMLLQPFAENAVIHGLQNKPENRELKIEAFGVGNGIRITLEDNGIGREEARKISTGKNGKGSKLMKERLEILQKRQGEKYSLEITDIHENGNTGTRVEIFIPEER